jgi:hypothetical protein
MGAKLAIGDGVAEANVTALVQLAVTSKNASLLHLGDLKAQARRSRPQAQAGLAAAAA